MRWKLRAWLLHKMAVLPGGYSVYQCLQRFAGLHCKADFIVDKLTLQRDIAREILASGGVLSGARVVEVGAGWVPLAPIGFWICGAEEIHTYDIHRHILPGVLRKALRWMGENEPQLIDLWEGIVPAERVRHCLQIIRDKAAQPLDLLREARINYLAPADAARTKLPDASMDIHYSISVFEHIPRDVILAILREARRVLKASGRCVHSIDPMDHFAYSDNRITSVNFLQYTNDQWQKYGGNSLAYHNRLRDSDFEELFTEAGFHLLKHSFALDSRGYEALQKGFEVAAEFRGTTAEQLSRRDLLFVGTTPGDVA